MLDRDSGVLRIVVVVDRPPDAPGTWYVIEDGYLTTRLACVARFGRLLERFLCGLNHRGFPLVA
ncbi:hypothetical protein CFR76_14860 [Komagataeibacter swingsii]|uniref:Uncharacterized protein n=2 Tax=Komagataeibacter TaxID=1434011 RepID=A0A2V4QVA5_9PROT|nr:hypothetical protein CFR76_14860 [Komagataeibacter swingsii]GBQ57495.1 hypothetical protein AA16373_1019 [Komagataeibacter swingsii DSM 16373]GBQ70375.1 hypothetical protein AA0521_1664 [Komagataeibacter intermedius NRIC 0521]